MANLTSIDMSGQNMTAAILDFTPDTQGTPQGMTEDESSMMSSCSSSSESSETPSLSLPSVPASVAAALPHAQSVNSLARCTSVSSMTMKEFDNKLNELRKENFNLKLRLYFMEKERNGITRPECESMVQSELNRKDHLISQLQQDVTLREEEIKCIKSTHEKSIKKLHSEWKAKMEQITLEKDEAVKTLAGVTTQLDTTSNLAKSLMDHLIEIRHFWKSNLDDFNSSKKVILSLNNWFNSSEDVLNSASVLITDDQENQSSFMNRSSHLAIGDHIKHHHNQRHLQTSAQACLPSSSTLLPNDGIDYHHQSIQEVYQNQYQDQQRMLLLQEQSSESDDWSEPNREVSRARIGLDILDDPDSCLIYPPSTLPLSLCPIVRTMGTNCSNQTGHKKHHSGYKSKRKVSGVSSLGLLSDISGLLVDEDDNGSRVDKVKHHKRPHTSEPFKIDVSLQTDLKFTTINAIFKDYNQLVNSLNKEITHAYVQVDTFTQPKNMSTFTQTEMKEFIDKSTPIQNDLKIPTRTMSTSSHDLVEKNSIAIQSDGRKKVSKSVQIQVTESSLPKDGQNLSKRAHFDQTFFSPCRELLNRTPNDGDVTTFKEISTSGHERIRMATSGHERIRMATSGHERTRMATSGLYTYKLSADHKVSSIANTKSRIPTSISHQALNCTSYQLTPTSSTGSKSCPNTPSSPPSSPLHVPLNHIQEEVPSSVVRSINSHSNVTTRSQKTHVQQSCQGCRSLERLTMDMNHHSPTVERLTMDMNHHSPTNSSSSSTSSLNEIVRKTSRRTATKVPLLSPLKEVSLTDDQWSNLNSNDQWSNLNSNSHHSRQERQSSNLEIRTNLAQSCECSRKIPPINSLSSPDLGIGDSDDHQEVGNLRACLPLSKYQRLRGLIHESICIMNSLEGIQRDFSLSILTRSEFVAESSPCLKSLSILLASAKATFKSFYIQDDNDKPMDMLKETVSIGTMARSDQDTERLKAELQRLKMKKQKMEKAISRQLQKTDQLLRKAAVINEITE